MKEQRLPCPFLQARPTCHPIVFTRPHCMTSLLLFNMHPLILRKLHAGCQPNNVSRTDNSPIPANSRHYTGVKHANRKEYLLLVFSSRMTMPICVIMSNDCSASTGQLKP